MVRFFAGVGNTPGIAAQLGMAARRKWRLVVNGGALGFVECDHRPFGEETVDVATHPRAIVDLVAA